MSRSNNPTHSDPRAIEGLVKTFASLKVLECNANAYSFNVVDPRFKELHTFFCEVQHAACIAADRAANRIRSWTLPVPATPTEYLHISVIQDHPGVTDANVMLNNLLNDGMTLCNYIKQIQPVVVETKDLLTSHILNEIDECLAKVGWKVKAFLGQQVQSWDNIKGLEILKQKSQQMYGQSALPARGQQTSSMV